MPYQPRATLENPYGPQVQFRTEDVLPPSAYYVAPDDSVTVFVLTDGGIMTIHLILRLLLPTGEVKLMPYQFNPVVGGDFYAAFEVPPVEGYILGAECWAANPIRGNCFVSVVVVRGNPPIMANAGLVLLQGYTNEMNILSYPTSPLEGTFTGHGAFTTVSLPDVTGAPQEFIAPNFVMWRLQSVRFLVTTSAAVANRTAFVSLLDLSLVQVGFWPAAFSLTAGQTALYCFSPGAQAVHTDQLATIAGPTELWIANQGRLHIELFGGQAGDQITQTSAMFEQWMGQ